MGAAFATAEAPAAFEDRRGLPVLRGAGAATSSSTTAEAPDERRDLPELLGVGAASSSSTIGSSTTAEAPEERRDLGVAALGVVAWIVPVDAPDERRDLPALAGSSTSATAEATEERRDLPELLGVGAAASSSSTAFGVEALGVAAFGVVALGVAVLGVAVLGVTALGVAGATPVEERRDAGVASSTSRRASAESERRFFCSVLGAESPKASLAQSAPPEDRRVSRALVVRPLGAACVGVEC